jgi:hypothetical protein
VVPRSEMAGRFSFMNGYSISRSWWDFAFANPEKVKPIHAALLFFAVEHCNRLGWKQKFGLPSSMAMEAIGVHSYTTYAVAFNDLCEWGFFELVQKSKNQYSSNIIALSKFDEAPDKALDKALIKHDLKQCESTCESTVSIDKQRTKNKETIEPTIEEVKAYFNEKGYSSDAAVRAYEYYSVNNWKDKSGKKVQNWKQKMIAVWFKPENKKQLTQANYATLTP